MIHNLTSTTIFSARLYPTPRPRLAKRTALGRNYSVYKRVSNDLASCAVILQQTSPIMNDPQELSFRQSVDRMFDRASANMDLPLGLADQIRSCNSVYQVQFGVKLGNRYEVFTGWRAVHSELILQVNGGIRYADFANQYEV